MNTLMMVVVVLVVLCYFGGKYCPSVLKQNKETAFNTLYEDMKNKPVCDEIVNRCLDNDKVWSYTLIKDFNAFILNKYDVGLCNRPNKEMSGRVVVPIYNSNYKSMIGCSGRRIYNK